MFEKSSNCVVLPSTNSFIKSGSSPPIKGDSIMTLFSEKLVSIELSGLRSDNFFSVRATADVSFRLLAAIKNRLEKLPQIFFNKFLFGAGRVRLKNFKIDVLRIKKM